VNFLEVIWRRMTKNLLEAAYGEIENKSTPAQFQIFY